MGSGLETSADDIASLAFKEFQAKQKSSASGEAGYVPPASDISAFKADEASTGTLTRGQLLEGIAKEAEEQKACKGPMEPAEYRRRQELAARPELAETPASALLAEPEKRSTPLSYEELLRRYHQPPAVPARSEEDKVSQSQMDEFGKAPGAEMQRLEMLKDMARSQMPAVDSEGLPSKTIEHYTFADGEDSVSFSINLDKDLFDGAASFLKENNQVKVSCRATSLDIRIQDVPVSLVAPETLVEWKLTLSPLYSRVEPLLTTHKVRGGKVSVRLVKSKVGPWKKGVKY